MTAAAAHQSPPEIDKTPEAICAVLLPEERDAFDADCRHALGEAVEHSSLQPVRNVLERWWRIATVTRHDPTAHRRMLARGDQTLTGQTPPRLRTWDELRTERGLWVTRKIEFPDEVWDQVHALPAEAATRFARR